MKLEINNKTFNGKYNQDGQLVIPLEDNSDVIFFKKWQDLIKISQRKSDYVKDIKFEKITESGVFKYCFPRLSINEDYVELYCDLYEVR